MLIFHLDFYGSLLTSLIVSIVSPLQQSYSPPSSQSDVFKTRAWKPLMASLLIQNKVSLPI